MEKNGKKISGESLRSNMRNRLLVILGEDICYNDWKVWVKVGWLMENWEKRRNQNDTLDRKYLVNLYSLLCNSKGSRMCSFIRSFYSYGVNVKKIRDKYSDLYEGVNKVKKEFGISYYVKGDGEKLKRFIDGFVKRLDQKSDLIFYWFFKIIEWKGSVGRRNRRSKSIFVIFDIIDKFLNFEKLKGSKTNPSSLLKKYCMNWVINNNNSRGENWLWCLCYLKFVMNRDTIDWKEKVDYTLEIDEIEVERLYKSKFKF